MQVWASLLISHELFILLFGLDDENGAVGVADAVIADTPEESPLEKAIAMAPHDQHVGSELVHHVADDAPGVPNGHLHIHLHLHLAVLFVVERAELLRLVPTASATARLYPSIAAVASLANR